MTTEQESLPIAKRPAAWKIVFNVVLLVGLLAIFAWQVKKNWAGIVTYPWHDLRWELALLALLALLVCSLLDVVIWNRALGWFSRPLTFVQAVPVFIWSNLARYIPGKVASLLLRVALAAEVDRRPVPVLASSALELALRTAAALFLALATLTTWGSFARHNVSNQMLYTAAGVIVAVLIGAHPKIMLPVLNWGLKKINKTPLSRAVRYRDVLGLLGLEALRWVCYGAAFALLGGALYAHAAQYSVALVGVAVASWAFGFIGMSPAGLGLAEGMQILVLSQSLHFPTEVTLILAVSLRLWSLAAEGLWSLAALALHRRTKQSPAVPTAKSA